MPAWLKGWRSRTHWNYAMHILRLRDVFNSPAPAAARYADRLIRAGLADFTTIMRRSLVPTSAPTSHDMVRP
jgi:hypothetical protein